MPSPLNPVLYRRLQEEFGRVQVAHAGAAANVQYLPDVLGGRTQLRMMSEDYGEYYRVNCPFCGDSRGRLWVNHLWAVPDKVTGSDNLWLAVCYNEGCLSQPGRRQELRDKLFAFKNAGQRNQLAQIVILPGEVEETALRLVDLPGFVIRLDRMPPTDPVCTYLQGRGLDPKDLGETFGVSYCTSADGNYPMAAGRIVVPIYMRGDLVGWQCRYPKDIDFKATGIPKYYNRPLMARRLMLYNFDNAKNFPYVVVCEGVTDVWNVGPQAVAAFGKKLSQTQVQLICATWPLAVVILLDGDAWEDAQALAKCFRDCGYQGQVIPVRLPPDKDPADLDHEFVWRCIGDETIKQVDLLKLKRADNDNRDTKRLSVWGPRSDNDSGWNMDSGGSVPAYSFDSPRDAAAGT